jgi:hypothetical protein
MARHYTIKEFFRQMPNALLARYFGERGLLGDLDFTSMREGQPVELFEAWLGLPDDQRKAMDAEFHDIFALSCDDGFQAIIDEADWHMASDPIGRNEFVENLSGLNNHFERAMVTFLDHRRFWKGALHFHHADSLSYWQKRVDLPQVAAAVDDESLRLLEHGISEHFHLTEGRGKHCAVEPFRRRDLDYFFAYPEDYSQESIEWDRGQFARRPHNPAFEIIFVYSQRNGSLDLYCRGAFKSVAPLQRIFTETILKTPGLGPAPRDERVYELNQLQSRSFDFVFDEADGILDVRVRKMRLSSRVRKGERLTVEADTTSDAFALYDLLAKIERGHSLQSYNVTQVELAVRVSETPEKPPKTVPIRITHPNFCSLKYDEMDLKLRRMLRDSGIEPGESEAVEEVVEVAEVAGG